MKPHDGGPSQAVPRARRPRPHISRPVAAGMVVLVAYGWWFTDLQPFSGGALLGLFGAVAGLVALGTAQRRSAETRGREDATAQAPAMRQSVIAWSVTVAVLAAWELIALFSQPRKEHPTISSMLATAMEQHPARFGVYLLWLALGWVIAS